MIVIALLFAAFDEFISAGAWPAGQSQYIMRWDHWVAFVLLVFLGGRMVLAG